MNDAVTRRPLQTLLRNAVSLLGTSAVTSGGGFAFWWLAARQLSPEDMGVSTAAVSNMLLLGTLGMLGLGSLMISDLGRWPGQAASVLSTSLLLSTAGSLAVGLVALWLLPEIVPSQIWIRSPEGAALFLAGLVATTVSLVFDQGVIGVLRGALQLQRNALTAVLKIALLFPALAAPHPVYTAWLGANLLSFMAVRGSKTGRSPALLATPDPALVAPLLRLGLRHHLLNMAMQAPPLIIPVLVASQVTPARNAQFYVAWMLASFLSMIPYSLATVLPAVNTAEPAELRQRVRQSLLWSLAGSVAGATLWILAAGPLLGIFGRAYIDAVPLLQLLALTVFPAIIKAHYIALGRMRGDLTRVAIAVALWGGAELIGVSLGARQGGTTGLAVGLLIASILEGLWMAWAMRRLLSLQP